jgi:hypothetical protein
MPQRSDGRVAYVDITIAIETTESVSITYLAKNVTKEKTGKLTLDPVTLLNIERMNAWVNLGLKLQQESPTGTQVNFPGTLEDLKVIGLNLYQILFRDKQLLEGFNTVYKQFDKDKKRDASLRLRLRLMFGKDADAVSRLPWEFLFIPENPDQNLLEGSFFSGQRVDLILTRLVPTSEEDQEDEEAGTVPAESLRILVVLSTPAGEGNIDSDDLRTMLEQLEKMPFKPRVEYLDKEACTTDQFTDKLKNFKPHIVHFIGHGREGQLAFIKKLTDADYNESSGRLQARWVPADQVRVLITNSGWQPRLVFLHACKGAAATSHDAFNSCARELVYADVPAVVAMQYNISNKDAASFAKTFYTALGKGRDLDEAVKAGRLILGEASPQWKHPRFAIPVVYLQTDRPLVQWTPETTTLSAVAADEVSAAAPSASQVASSGPAAAPRRASEPARSVPATSRGSDVSSFGG